MVVEINMANEADQAAIVEELYLNQSMAHCKRPESTAPITGWCNQCGKSVDGQRRWCDNVCSDEWVKENG